MPLPVVSPWRCLKTGDCCRDVVMTVQEWHTIAHVRPDVTPPVPRGTEGRFVEYSGVCPLLTSEKLCGVYEQRPYNCRRFLCLRSSVEEPLRMDGAGVLGCVNTRIRFFENRDLRRQVQHVQQKSQRWALAHGWRQDDV